jgi:hypothetical protein
MRTAFCAARRCAPRLRRRAARLACSPSAACDAARRSSRLSPCRTAGCSPAQRLPAGVCGDSPRALLGARGGAPRDAELHVRPTRPTQADRARLLRRACPVLALADVVDLLAHEWRARAWVLEAFPLRLGDTRVSGSPSSAARSPPSGAVLTPARWRRAAPDGDELAHPGSALLPLFRTLTEPIRVEWRTGAGSLRERDWWRASPR